MRELGMKIVHLCLFVVAIALAPILIAQEQSSVGGVHLSVAGDVSKPLTLSVEDLASFPRRIVSLQQRDGTTASYEGMPLVEILKKAGVPSGEKLRGKALASYVVAHARDGYEVTFALAELDPELHDNNVVVADKRDGKPLNAQEGPLRIVVPSDKKPARSIRMVDELRVVMLRKDEGAQH
jgi:DMSO/TMAO reductase YedYZ molybdopterin-dependent catalytic subunit